MIAWCHSNEATLSHLSLVMPRMALPDVATWKRPPRSQEPCTKKTRPEEESRGDPQPPTDNPYSYDNAVLAIFPEYIEFDGEDVLQLAVKKEPRKSTD